MRRMYCVYVAITYVLVIIESKSLWKLRRYIKTRNKLSNTNEIRSVEAEAEEHVWVSEKYSKNWQHPHIVLFLSRIESTMKTKLNA